MTRSNRRCPREVQCRAAVLRLDGHRVLQPQVQRHELADVGFVFDDEDVRMGGDCIHLSAAYRRTS